MWILIVLINISIKMYNSSPGNQTAYTRNYSIVRFVAVAWDTIVEPKLRESLKLRMEKVTMEWKICLLTNTKIMIWYLRRNCGSSLIHF